MPNPMNTYTESNFPYVSIVCVSPNHVEVANLSIASLLAFSSATKIVICCSQAVWNRLAATITGSGRVEFLCEDFVVPNCSLDAIQRILNDRVPANAGWYFQQILKMGFALNACPTSHYLIWDADTIALRELQFFDPDSRTLLQPGDEFHAPYFRTMRELLKIERKVDYSFISEHMMITRNVMLELIKAIEQKCHSGQTWVERIFECISDADLSNNGFSEFETYGNYMATEYPESFAIRKIKSTRDGAMRHGLIPDKYALQILTLKGYDYVSFGRHCQVVGWRLFIRKIRDRWYWWRRSSLLTGGRQLSGI